MTFIKIGIGDNAKPFPEDAENIDNPLPEDAENIDYPLPEDAENPRESSSSESEYSDSENGDGHIRLHNQRNLNRNYADAKFKDNELNDLLWNTYMVSTVSCLYGIVPWNYCPAGKMNHIYGGVTSFLIQVLFFIEKLYCSKHISDASYHRRKIFLSIYTCLCFIMTVWFVVNSFWIIGIAVLELENKNVSTTCYSTLYRLIFGIILFLWGIFTSCVGLTACNSRKNNNI